MSRRVKNPQLPLRVTVYFLYNIKLEEVCPNAFIDGGFKYNGRKILCIVKLWMSDE